MLVYKKGEVTVKRMTNLINIMNDAELKGLIAFYVASSSRKELEKIILTYFTKDGNEEI